MRRIAEKIDYSPAAIYKYFDSKEALFDEIREQFFERLLRRLEKTCDQITEGPKLCEACLRAYVETGLERPSHYRLAFASWVKDNTPHEDSFAFAAADHLEMQIQQSIDDGWFEPTDIRLATSTVWAAAHGLTMLAVALPEFPHGRPGCEDLTLDEVIDYQAEHVMRGFSTQKLRDKMATN